MSYTVSVNVVLSSGIFPVLIHDGSLLLGNNEVNFPSLDILEIVRWYRLHGYEIDAINDFMSHFADGECLHGGRECKSPFCPIGDSDRCHSEAVTILSSGYSTDSDKSDAMLFLEKEKIVSAKREEKGKKKTDSHHNNIPGQIYVLMADNGKYKIGRGKDGIGRVGILSTQLPYKIKVVLMRDTSDSILAEKMLHKMFGNKRLNGEWFDLIPDDIETIRNTKLP